MSGLSGRQLAAGPDSTNASMAGSEKRARTPARPSHQQYRRDYQAGADIRDPNDPRPE